MLQSMNKPLTILTGASRGLGRGMAELLLQAGHRLLTISRRPCDLVAPAGAEHLAWSQDLADSGAAAARLEGWLAEQDQSALSSATMIHNAGMLSSLAPLSANGAAELARALRVDLEAPMVLTAGFLRATAAWALPRKVLLISSGLGRFALPGSASYCAAKAGMDHLARAVALEEAEKPNGARIVSLAPGVIDTDMQVQLRGADPKLFSARQRFLDMQASGQLLSPLDAARRVLAYLARDDFGAHPVADTREAK
jgi:NAD(P)-dependent dehydrogenase (short-subunit alcohol dehydrogenase family)